MRGGIFSKAGLRRYRRERDSGSQSQPATGASSFQNAPTAFGFHTSAEAMIAGALEAAGLECSFHLESIFWFICRPAGDDVRARTGR